MIGDPFGIPLHGCAGRSADEFRQCSGAVDTGGDGQHGAHRGGSVGCGDHRGAAVHDGAGKGEGDLDPGTRERDGQHDAIGSENLESGTGGMICGAAEFVVVNLPLRWRRKPVHGIDRGAARPQHIRGVQHDAQRTSGVWAHLESRGHRLRPRAGGQNLVNGRLLETVQQFADRFVDPVDACHSRRARDHADLVGAVARVVGLPQRVTSPPAAHVRVDHRHEVHRLARRLAEVDEERGVGRVQQHTRRIRIAGRQRFDRAVRILQQRLPFGGACVEFSRDGAGVAGI